MKTTITLEEKDIEIAIKEYVESQGYKFVKASFIFSQDEKQETTAVCVICEVSPKPLPSTSIYDR